MAQVISQKRKYDPWGDDHLEKVNQTQKTIGFANQLKGLVNPDKMLSQIFGEKNAYPGSESYEYKEKRIKKNEVLVFSYAHEKDEKEMVEQSKVILQKLQEQITLLEKSEKNFSKEVSKVKFERLPKKTGVYYIRFLEWMMIVVRQLRMKVEDGRAWLETFSQKKKKKLGYWKMYKKHGTTFGLSHERTLATQTG